MTAAKALGHLTDAKHSAIAVSVRPLDDPGSKTEMESADE